MGIAEIWDALSIETAKGWILKWYVKLGFGMTARINFYESLTLSLDNGESVMDTLEQQREAFDEDGSAVIPAPQLIIIEDCIRALSRGDQLADALYEWVGIQEVSLIAAGESSGDLVAGLDRAVESLERRQELQRVLKEALMWPAVIGMGIVSAIFYISLELIPELLRMQPKESWPAPTQKMIGLGLFVVGNWAYLLAAFLCIAGWLAWALPNLTGRLRDRFDKLPIFSTYRVFVGTTFLLNVSALLAAGIPLEQALIDMARYANAYLRERIDDTVRGIKTGANFGQALQFTEHEFPDKATVRNVKALSEKKGFEIALEKFTKRWLKQNMKLMERSAVVLRLVMLLIGAYVIVTMFQGVYGIAQRR
ncbi:type II secretion system F family protein [Xanthomonas euvesicatoria pv. eucalypti]|uniref:type II secretion system F family protein n=1 Tax=Xanthomonas euvesicatoria TaxID=456327 RepID=UPI00080E0B5C|nr:type II secretion system F family protein [Xanthomonas euvesicatoria]MCC8799141.1 type II secretion system F family protein [Xanthomonas euvesicatoria pv. euvesicatoria]MCC8807746.1 type II secretion system F family protein [Xanthomonas euvesicatoria pv. euvesicatoria]MCC8816191.1 type II secretion system F family protein [Xanthomonas euvesicatoria pv. euvesicatoria]MDO7931594.1 type II secretion system F family protein [Xanthomonas euvesicatoria pv. eucalypti]MDO7935679.1 type II secretion